MRWGWTLEGDPSTTIRASGPRGSCAFTYKADEGFWDGTVTGRGGMPRRAEIHQDHTQELALSLQAGPYGSKPRGDLYARFPPRGTAVHPACVRGAFQVARDLVGIGRPTRDELLEHLPAVMRVTYVELPVCFRGLGATDVLYAIALRIVGSTSFAGLAPDWCFPEGSTIDPARRVWRRLSRSRRFSGNAAFLFDGREL